MLRFLIARFRYVMRRSTVPPAVLSASAGVASHGLIGSISLQTEHNLLRRIRRSAWDDFGRCNPVGCSGVNAGPHEYGID